MLLRAGMPPMNTVGDPGAHGAGMTGKQGAGVGVPIAADVAAITSGLAGAIHIPNEGMFMMGTLSMMVAAGVPSATVRFSGRTTRVAGAIPKVQVNVPLLFTT
jgi:hypothetical protein